MNIVINFPFVQVCRSRAWTAATEVTCRTCPTGLPRTTNARRDVDVIAFSKIHQPPLWTNPKYVSDEPILYLSMLGSTTHTCSLSDAITIRFYICKNNNGALWCALSCCMLSWCMLSWCASSCCILSSCMLSWCALSWCMLSCCMMSWCALSQEQFRKCFMNCDILFWIIFLSTVRH